MAKRKNNNTANYFSIGVLLLILFFFRDKLTEIFNSIFSKKVSSSDARQKVETIQTQEKNVNNLGMKIPKLEDLLRPIEYLQSIPKFNIVNKTTNTVDSQMVRDTSELFAYTGGREAVSPIYAPSKGMDIGFQPIGSLSKATAFSMFSNSMF